MMFSSNLRFLCLSFFLLPGPVFAASNFKNFLEFGDDWSQVEAIQLSSNEMSLVEEGSGAILVNGKDWANTSNIMANLYTEDCIVKVEFLLPKESSASLFILSRYAVNIVDSSHKHELNANDMGGVVGVPPLVNASGKPGEWQTLEVKFRSPRYNEAGTKIDNALFLEVRINDQLVQENVIAKHFSEGSLFNWEQPDGRAVIRASKGQIAIRNFDVRRADYSAITVPKDNGMRTNVQELTDFVAQGKKNFQVFGCVECHTTKQGDESVKSGPNLFGLFSLTPRDREIVESGENHRFTIKADNIYLHRSVREPASQLATKEAGPNKGEAFLPVMPAYKNDMTPDKSIDAIGDYLLTLNEPYNQGPIEKLMPDSGPKKYDPMEDRFQFLVGKRTRIQRGPMLGTSGRAIHVGFPGGVNYSYDPRILSIVKIWQGGFLDMSGELQNRGGSGLEPGYASTHIDFGGVEYLVAPLNTDNKLIDFTFKEAKFRDSESALQSLNAKKDHLTSLGSIDAQFLGYSIDSREDENVPVFSSRVGENDIHMQTRLSSSGDIAVHISGSFSKPQTFAINTSVITNAAIKGGTIKGNIVRIPKGEKADALLSGNIALSSSAWISDESEFESQSQTLETKISQASLPDGYSVKSILPPKDNYNREQLFEALGLAVAKDGTIVVSTRTAGIWRIVEGEWKFFADGVFDSLGLAVEDDKGLVLTVGQKAELTRISDINGDGLADSFKTLFDAFSYHGNYHTYMHGPVKTGDGKYFVTLNLAHDDNAFKAGGQYMGTFGGFSGWGFEVSENGAYVPWVNGMRSPAGLGVSPENRIWYADNQGEYMGTSKLFSVEKNDFFGHPAGLVDLPGITPKSANISWEKVKEKRKRAAVLFPHNWLANSPGHLAWDLSEGKFGPFKGQIFMGDQTQSNLFRVVIENIAGVEQGVAIPFAENLESGVMRPVFLADGSMILGQTGRGWQAKGGNVASLQQLAWDGKTLAKEILKVEARPKGFEVFFTAPVKAFSLDMLKVRSWVYRDAANYGSPELGVNNENIKAYFLSDNKKSVVFELDSVNYEQVHPDQTARVFHIEINRERAFGRGENSNRRLDAFYTLNAWPQQH